MNHVYVIRYKDGAYNMLSGHPVLRHEATEYPTYDEAFIASQMLCDVAEIEETIPFDEMMEPKGLTNDETWKKTTFTAEELLSFPRHKIERANIAKMLKEICIHKQMFEEAANLRQVQRNYESN
jgi:hypothetical protein